MHPMTAKANAATVMRIETSLAKVSLTRVQRRNHAQRLSPLHDEDTAEGGACVRLEDLLHQRSGSKPDPWLNVAEPAFFKELNARIASESLKNIKTYLRWALVDASADYLASPFVNEHVGILPQVPARRGDRSARAGASA